VLLVEILSPSNEAQTWRNVWTCTTIPSVTEILAVRSTRIEAELLRRLPDGNWPKQPEIFGSGDRLTLASIGLSLLPDAFYVTSSMLGGEAPTRPGKVRTFPRAKASATSIGSVRQIDLG
jgi:hypothetical protein